MLDVKRGFVNEEYVLDDIRNDECLFLNGEEGLWEIGKFWCY